MTEMPRQQCNTVNPAEEPGAVRPSAPDTAPAATRSSFDNAGEPMPPSDFDFVGANHFRTEDCSRLAWM